MRLSEAGISTPITEFDPKEARMGFIVHKVAVVTAVVVIRRLGSGFSWYGHEFDPTALVLIFVVIKVTVGQFYIRIILFYLVAVIPPYPASSVDAV